MTYESNRSGGGQHAQRAQMMARPQRLELEEDNGSGEWGEEDFNLLEYIGKDLTPVVDAQGYPLEEPLEDDDGVRKENREEYLYQTEQIQHALYSDYSHHEGMISPGMDPMLNGGGDSNDSVFNELPPSAGFEPAQAAQVSSVPSSSQSQNVVVAAGRSQPVRHSHHQHHQPHHYKSNNTPTMVTSASRANSRTAMLVASTSSNGQQRVIKVVKSETPTSTHVSIIEPSLPIDDDWFASGALEDELVDFQQAIDGHDAAALFALQQPHQQRAGGGPMRAGEPRKYRIKSENERKNPVYRQKREKNNDAVRRSRNKAKVEQEERAARLKHIEDESAAKDNLIQSLKSQLATTNKVMEQLLTKNKNTEKELASNLKLLANCTCRRGSSSRASTTNNHR